MNWTQATTCLMLPTTPAEWLPFLVIPLDLEGALLDLWKVKDNTISIPWGNGIAYKRYTYPSGLNYTNIWSNSECTRELNKKFLNSRNKIKLSVNCTEVPWLDQPPQPFCGVPITFKYKYLNIVSQHKLDGVSNFPQTMDLKAVHDLMTYLVCGLLLTTEPVIPNQEKNLKWPRR